MKTQRGFTVIELVFAIVALIGAGGWLANLFKLIEMLDGDVTAMLIARAVGLFVAPLGAILGFM